MIQPDWEHAERVIEAAHRLKWDAVYEPDEIFFNEVARRAAHKRLFERRVQMKDPVALEIQSQSDYDQGIKEAS